jgi:hypothetical protein
VCLQESLRLWSKLSLLPKLFCFKRLWNSSTLLPYVMDNNNDWHFKAMCQVFKFELYPKLLQILWVPWFNNVCWTKTKVIKVSF